MSSLFQTKLQKIIVLVWGIIIAFIWISEAETSGASTTSEGLIRVTPFNTQDVVAWSIGITIFTFALLAFFTPMKNRQQN